MTNSNQLLYLESKQKRIYVLVNMPGNRFPKELKSQKHKWPKKLKWYFTSLLSFTATTITLANMKEILQTNCRFLYMYALKQKEMQTLHPRWTAELGKSTYLQPGQAPESAGSSPCCWYLLPGSAITPYLPLLYRWGRCSWTKEICLTKVI